MSPAGLLEPGRVQMATGDEAENTLLAAASHPWPPAETAVTNLKAETAAGGVTLSWDPPNLRD